jgi:hypothetical protein
MPWAITTAGWGPCLRSANGVPIACKIAMKPSAPRASFAYPCSMNPKPRISRRGSAYQLGGKRKRRNAQSP